MRAFFPQEFYFSATLTDVKLDLTTDPRLFTVATTAKAIPDATTAYSIDVAPEQEGDDGSLSNRLHREFE
jgi:hypothetical protein